MPEPHCQPTPELFLETATAYQRTACLKAAVDLDLFTAIAEGATEAEHLARRCGASVRGIRVLCESLAALGLLVKNGAGFALTADSAVFLDRRSPAYLGGALEFLLSEAQTAGFRDVAAAVRKGGKALDGDGPAAEDEQVWVKFARGMAPLMVPAAQFIAGVTANGGRPMRVLDLAAGHGLFGIEIAKRNPRAEVVAVDSEPVLEVAAENAARAGVADRHRCLPGDALTLELGEGYDVALLTNFLHQFDPETCTALLRKVHAALKPEGCAVTLEFIPNEDRISPPIAATFSLVMLVNTEGGEAYTFSELKQMFEAAGFPENELHDLDGAPQRVVVSRKRPAGAGDTRH